MNGMKHLLNCAVIGWCMVGAAVAQTQDSEGGPAGAAPGAATEKSLLTAGVAPAKADGTSIGFCQCVGDSEAAGTRKIEQALSGPLHSAGLDYAEQPLNDVVSQLQDDYGIPIQLDHAALEAVGVRPDEQVTSNLHNISLRSALRLMLKKLQLTYIIQDEVLLITTPDEAEKTLKVWVYNVASIAGERGVQMDALSDTILSCVATDTWAENGGGQAAIRPIKPGLLVISQTAAVHEEIRDLMAAIRKVRSENAREVKTSADANVPTPNEVVTRSYLLQLNPSDDINTMRSQIRELITGSLPDEVWTGRLADGQAVTLTVFHDRIVVRQTPAVQEKLQKILADSGIATPSTGVAANESGGGFGRGGGGGGFFRPSLENSGRYGASGSPLGANPTAPEPAGDSPFAN